IKYHIVKRGDTLGRIAINNHTTVTKLCQLNGIKRTSTLRIGQRIRVR
ncbi:MAG: LysM peptidoglycan-binding domain-containing protein, partial [Alistipes sp.]|nr:LysM peptidoglycan-binding domain-containing protein [Alistipes sp.]